MSEDAEKTEPDIGKTLAELGAIMEDNEKNLRIDDEIPLPCEVHSINVGFEAGLNQEDIIPTGSWVAVRVAGQPATYLGILLGRLPAEGMATYHVEKKALKLLVVRNPAMYVPDLKRVVWGMESWWRPIRKPEELKQITDKDIENVWYVRALKELEAAKAGA